MVGGVEPGEHCLRNTGQSYGTRVGEDEYLRWVKRTGWDSANPGAGKFHRRPGNGGAICNRSGVRLRPPSRSL